MRFGSLVLFQSRGNVVINDKNNARSGTVVTDQGARHHRPNESNESGFAVSSVAPRSATLGRLIGEEHCGATVAATNDICCWSCLLHISFANCVYAFLVAAVMCAFQETCLVVCVFDFVFVFVSCCALERD